MNCTICLRPLSSKDNNNTCWLCKEGIDLNDKMECKECGLTHGLHVSDCSKKVNQAEAAKDKK